MEVQGFAAFFVGWSTYFLEFIPLCWADSSDSFILPLTWVFSVPWLASYSVSMPPYPPSHPIRCLFPRCCKLRQFFQMSVPLADAKALLSSSTGHSCSTSSSHSSCADPSVHLIFPVIEIEEGQLVSFQLALDNLLLHFQALRLLPFFQSFLCVIPFVPYDQQATPFRVGSLIASKKVQLETIRTSTQEKKGIMNGAAYLSYNLRKFIVIPTYFG